MDDNLTELKWRSPELLAIDRAIMIVVDVQEKLVPLINDHKKIIWNIARLLQGMQIMQVHVLATEQYPQGLKPTVVALATLLKKCTYQTPGAAISEKLCFSCCGSAEFVKQLTDSKRTQIILTGLEAHVCILQTAHDLLAQGYNVQLVVDAI